MKDLTIRELLLFCEEKHITEYVFSSDRQDYEIALSNIQFRIPLSNMTAMEADGEICFGIGWYKDIVRISRINKIQLRSGCDEYRNTLFIECREGRNTNRKYVILMR